MAVVHYPAVIEREKEGGFSVSFPDVPGCFTCGDTINEAALMAEEALSGHLLAAYDQGIAIADPTPFDLVDARAWTDVAAITLVRAEKPGRAMRIQVTMDEGLVARIDKFAPNRSRFLADAARAALPA